MTPASVAQTAQLVCALFLDRERTTAMDHDFELVGSLQGWFEEAERLWTKVEEPPPPDPMRLALSQIARWSCRNHGSEYGQDCRTIWPTAEGQWCHPCVARRGLGIPVEDDSSDG